MKTTLIMLLSCLILCGGCSKKRASFPGTAIEGVTVGDTTWHIGSTVYTLHVTKRDGTSLDGVSISTKLPTGQTQTVSADTATLSTVANATDDKSVVITFHNAKMQTGSESLALGADSSMELHE